MILYFFFFFNYCLQQTNLSWTCASLKRYFKYRPTKGIWSKCNHSKALYNPVPTHIVVCQSMRYSPLVLMAFPDGLQVMTSGCLLCWLAETRCRLNEYLRGGWIARQAGLWGGMVNRQQRWPKPRSCPLDRASLKPEERASQAGSKRMLPIHYIINALFIPDKSELFLKNLDII